MLVNRIISSAALRMSFILFSAIVAFFMLPFLAHNLGARDYGLWAVVTAIIGYYGALDLGISSAVGRFVGQAYGRENYDEINYIISTSIAAFLVIGSLLFIAMCVGTFYLKDIFVKNPDEANAIFYMVVILSVVITAEFPLRALTGVVYANVSHHLIVISEYSKLIVRTFLMILSIYKGYGIITLAAMFAVGEIVGSVLQFYLIITRYPELRIRRFYVSMERFKKLLGYGWIAFVVRSMVLVKTRFIPVLVSALISVELVVLYVVALRLVGYINQFVTTITGIFAPIFSRKEDDLDSLIDGYYNASQIMIYIVLYFGLSVAFYSKWLIPIWMGDEFANAYLLTILLVIPFVTMSLQYISREVLFGLSKHGYCAVVDTFEVVLIIVSSIFLTKLYGLYGIGISFALVVTLGELMFPYFVSKALNKSPLHIYTKVFFIPALKILPVLLLFFFVANVYVEYSYISLIKWNIIQALTLFPLMYFMFPEILQKVIRSKLNIAQRKLLAF